MASPGCTAHVPAVAGAYPAAAAAARGGARGVDPREAAAAEDPDRHPDRHPGPDGRAQMQQSVKRRAGVGADPQAAEAAGPAPQRDSSAPHSGEVWLRADPAAAVLHQRARPAVKI